jgi:hypothetical protein
VDTARELIDRTVKSIQEGQRGFNGYAKPDRPACVAYYGSRSRAFHGELYKDVSAVWGGNTDYVRFFQIDNPSGDIAVSDMDGEALDGAQLKNSVGEMFRAGNIFSDMSRGLSLFCVFDTTQVNSVSEFESWYNAVTSLEGRLYETVKSMLILILNEDAGYGDNAKLFRRFMYDDYAANGRYPYKSVFVLSNQLKSGLVINTDPTSGEYENYNLYADIILLANTSGANDKNRATLMYSPKAFFTVSYASVQKPVRDIAFVTVSEIFSYFNARCESAARQSVTSAGLMGALGISANRFAAFDELFDRYVSSRLPDSGCIDYLPSAGGLPQNYGALKYKELDALTLGCWSAYYAQSFKSALDGALSSASAVSQFRESVISSICAAVGFPTLAGGITRDDITGILRGLTALYDAQISQLPAYEASIYMLKKDGVIALTDVCCDAAEAARELARKCREDFNALLSEFQWNYSVGDEGSRQNVEKYYSKLVSAEVGVYVDSQGIYKTFERAGNDRAALAECIEKCVLGIVEKNTIYNASFDSELAQRLAAAGINAGQLISSELMQGITDKACLRSTSSLPPPSYQVFMVGKNTATANHLQSISPVTQPREFFDTKRNDSVETLLLYDCENSYLL